MSPLRLAALALGLLATACEGDGPLEPERRIFICGLLDGRINPPAVGTPWNAPQACSTTQLENPIGIQPIPGAPTDTIRRP